MRCCYDLHTHSTASDGSLTPGELVIKAASAGIAALALTDHDTVEGLAEAARAAAGAGIALINGIEISVTWNRCTVHIVGLGIDPDHPGLLAGLRKLREYRDWRAEEIGNRLHKAGIPGALEGARRFAGDGLVSRTHFAHFLAETGRAKNVQDVFKRYLVKNKPGHVPGDWASLPEAVGWILGAGGQAVVAHPARYDMTATKLRSMLGEFRELGGTGIEVVSGSHSLDDYQVMARLAGDMKFLASAGSDYHGPNNFRIELGHLPSLPASCTPIWHDWPHRRAA